MKKTVSLSTLLTCAMLVGCATKDKETNTDQPEKLKVPVVQLSQRPTTVQRDYVTTLEAVRNVEIRARVSGFLEKIYVDEGQSVRQGQLLFSLNAAEYRVGLEKAQATLRSAIAGAKTAEVEVDRVKLLVDKKIVSPSELELAKAKLDAARAQIEEAQSAKSTAALRLAHASIRAPFDGVINRIPYKIGSLIEEGALLTEVSDIHEVFAYFDVSEKEYLGFLKKHRDLVGKNGQEVEMMLADETPYPQKGRIETMESVFEEESGTIAFRARFPNPQKLLKHGSSGKIRLPIVVSDAFLVPQKAVFEVLDKNYVYVVDASNKVRSRSFVPQARVGLNYIVRSGLKPGERVVYEGIQNIRDGDQIIPQALSADSTRNDLARQ
ncbi:efflux RND transporter periplasmic adaptor subunit [Spirosoma sp.]|uniref:efflux RND transporter periplasmic adaptor subunit n=1 Tax=Spirosoma sp. TaxID=1899569 RepID=UPI003B3B28DA